ncbi:troponin C-like [Diaphorina citri]|uniref:Troponin C-like n=1 Tax=Diaphorina citri TaxID=121845 RepID=A0A1S4E804_DIACI|nr:troponin C-like [Diaphorina citri]
MATEKPQLSKDQMAMLTRAFEAFDQEKKGSIPTDMVGTIMEMLGHPQSQEALNEIIKEVDEDGSGELEFNEFCTLAAKFLEEEEENPEAMRAELREAFMLYDREEFMSIMIGKYTLYVQMCDTIPCWIQDKHKIKVASQFSP